MKTREEVVETLMSIDWSGRNSLCETVHNKYNGEVSKFLENEFNVIDKGCLHITWKDGDSVKKVSYEL